MLAQMEGKALYDRAARSPGRATFTCFLLLWCSDLRTLGVPISQVPAGVTTPNGLSSTRAIRDIAPGYHWPPLSDQHGRARGRRPSLPTDLVDLTTRKGPEKPNVAGLGESLYTDHLVTVGLAGVLLFVALVGAVAIANPRAADPARPAQPSPPADRDVLIAGFIDPTRTIQRNRLAMAADRCLHARRAQRTTCWSGPRCSRWGCSASWRGGT